MALVLDLLNRDPRPNAGNPKAETPPAAAELRHPEKQKRPDNPVLRKPDWIRVKAPGSPEMGRDPEDREGEQARHGLRGGRLPEYRRVLGEEARHLHDHGRHLHAGLRLLQREDRRAAARSICDEPRKVAEAVAKLGLEHVVITSVDRDDLEGRRRRALRPA